MNDNYWKKKFFVAKKKIIKYEKEMREIQEDSYVINKFSISMDDFLNPSNLKKELIEELKPMEQRKTEIEIEEFKVKSYYRLAELKLGLIGRLLTNVKGLYNKYAFRLKYSKFGRYMKYLRYLIITYSTLTVINSVFHKYIAGEFSWNLIVDLVQVFLSLF